MNITQTIAASPEGGTVSLIGEDLPTTGYFVGGMVSPLVLGNGIDFTPDALFEIDVFVDYVRTRVGAEFIGWWTDEETGKVWIDATDWYETEFRAGRAGRRRREIAIFDIARQCELRLAYAEGE